MSVIFSKGNIRPIAVRAVHFEMFPACVTWPICVRGVPRDDLGWSAVRAVPYDDLRWSM